MSHPMRKNAALLLAGLLIATSVGATAVAQENKGVLSLAQGSVEIKKAGSAQWAPAQQGAEIAPGDALKTAPGAMADIRLHDGSYMRLTPDTQVTVDAMNLAQEKARFLYFFSRSVKADKTKVTLDHGQVLATVRKLPNSQSSFRVQTPKGVAGVRGTGWGVGDNQVFVSNGFIDWFSAKESGQQDWLAGFASLLAARREDSEDKPKGKKTHLAEGLSGTPDEDGLTNIGQLTTQQLSAIGNLEQRYLGEVPPTVSQKASNDYVHDEIVGPDGGTAGALDASHGSLSSPTNDEERILDPEVNKQLEKDTAPPAPKSSSEQI